MKFFLPSFLGALLWAQGPASPPPPSDPGEAAREQAELSRALAEAGSSPVDYIRALENHLAKYPGTAQRALIEKALAKSAMDAGDNARIILYGEKVLAARDGEKAPAAEKTDDLQLLDRVIRALLEKAGPEDSKRALEYAGRFERDVAAMRAGAPQGHMSLARWNEQLDRLEARSLVLEARATGDMGEPLQAVALAEKSWKTWPTGEAARERAWWLTRLGRAPDAIDSYADAFTLEDPQSTEADRAQDRRRMGELYVKANGSEKGLGDLILKAYDRTSALMNERLASINAQDPNASAKKILDFVLPAADGGAPLRLASLSGKTLVFDFWATWCEPCRVQHPMIEKVRKRLENDPGVSFISVDTDDDRSLVTPFMKEQHWTGAAYYEAGLMRLLNITSIPTVLVLDPQGHTSSRMVGFIPERFEDMLAERIAEAKKAGAASSAAK